MTIKTSLGQLVKCIFLLIYFTAVVTLIFYLQPAGVVTFDWTPQQQAYVLSGYFWGYAITCLVGGTAAEFWGPRKLVFVTMFLSGILTIISPQAAKLHYMALVALRFVSGLLAVSLFLF